MIYFKEEDSLYYKEAIPQLERINEVIKKIRQGEYEAGSYKLADDLAVNIFSYETTTSSERMWEAHENHLDVHIVLEGEEQVDFVDTNHVVKTDIDLENDSYSFQEEATNRLFLGTRQWLIVYPNEGHKTGISLDQSLKLSKAVFKIKVK